MPIARLDSLNVADKYKAHMAKFALTARGIEAQADLAQMRAEEAAELAAKQHA